MSWDTVPGTERDWGTVLSPYWLARNRSEQNSNFYCCRTTSWSRHFSQNFGINAETSPERLPEYSSATHRVEIYTSRGKLKRWKILLEAKTSSCTKPEK